MNEITNTKNSDCDDNFQKKGIFLRHVQFWLGDHRRATSMGGWLEFYNSFTKKWEKVPTVDAYGHLEDIDHNTSNFVADRYEERKSK